jgi:hypothetical protein
VAPNFEKLSIVVPRALATALRRHLGKRGVSSFAARALQHELEREKLTRYLDELDAEHGPVPEHLLDEARRAWRKT